MTEATLANYQQQEASMTLKEGLEEYYQRNQNLISPDNCDNPEVTKLFKRHDIIHVLFGCSTSLHDETLADTWTIFGSTIKLREYFGYLNYSETTDILKQIQVSSIIRETLGAIPDVFKVIGRCRKMPKKWNWADYEAYLNHSLKELRDEYGIQILATGS